MPSKKIIAIIASPRKKETWAITHAFADQLNRRVPCEVEYVFLKEMNVQPCRGCFVCLTKGDEFCPLKDDREMLVMKMQQADGVIFATPNYSLQVSAIMKNFLDRIAYTLHRPCFFSVKCTAIVTQGAIGAKKILGYFKDVAAFTGFEYVPGMGVTAVTPRTAAEQTRIDRAIRDTAGRFARALQNTTAAHPTLMQVSAFRMIRSMYRTTPDDSLKDVRYYRGNGWFTSGYFYPVRLSFFQSILGWLIDRYGARFARDRKRALGLTAPV
jgi:multimeric flavodoxin WrbA